MAELSASTSPAYSTGRHALAVVLILLAIWSLAAGLTDLWGPDESRYAQVGKELLGRSNWLMMTLHGEPYGEKPPLPFWMQAAMVKLAGGRVYSLPARLPGILLGLLAVLSTYAIGRHRFGPRAGWLAALLLATTTLFLNCGPLAKLDMPFTGLITLTIALWLTRPGLQALSPGRAGLFWFALAAAFFVKGPVAFLVVLAVIAGECWAARSGRPLLSMRAAWGIPLLLLMIFGWMYGEAQGAGWDFVKGQFHGQTVDRALKGAHYEPAWYYLVRFLVPIFAPWSFVMIPLALTLHRRREKLRELAPELTWLLIPLLLFSLFHGKRQPYLLPLSPAIALLAAWQLNEYFERQARFPRLARGIGLALTILAAATPIAIVTLIMNSRRLAGQMVFFTPFSYALLALIALVVGWLGWRLLRSTGEIALLIGVLATVSALSFIATACVFDPARNARRSNREFAMRIEQLLHARGENLVGGLGDGGKPEYDVYGTYTVRNIDDDPSAFTNSQPLPGVIVGQKSDWKKIGTAATQAGYVMAFKTVTGGDEMIVCVKTGDAATSVTAPRP